MTAGRMSIALPKSFFPLTWTEWKVAPGQSVGRGTVLGLYARSAGGRMSELRAEGPGTVEELLVTAGEMLNESRPLGTLNASSCSHAVQLQGLCALCGKDLTTTPDTEHAAISMTHDAKGITLSLGEAKRIEKETTDRLLAEKKLSLLLDLDQTVIHAAVDPRIGMWMKEPSNPNYPLVKDVTSFTLPDSPVEYFIKLRPGTKEFLKEASKKYEMHIYTMGTRNYAQAVAKIIDPDQSYFKERILSRDESGSFVAKSIQRLFPCDQSMVVVVDDRGDVWHWSPNLIKVHPYNFFVGIGDINEPGKPSVPETENGGVVADLSSTSAATPVTLPQQASQLPTTGTTPEGETDPLLEEFLSTATGTPLIGGSLLPPGQTSAIPTSLDTEETVHEETDNELARVRRLLNEIHSSYYKSLLDDGDFHQEPDVRIILPDMRRTILRGVSVVFSGVIPLGTDPTSHELYQIATAFGAMVTDAITSHTTHVVAAKKGTVKVNQAKKTPGIFIVSPEWLHVCSTLWGRAAEDDFILEPNAVSTAAPKLFVRVNSSSSDNLQVDEQDFAILSGVYDQSLSAHFGSQDWLEMDREVEEAMNEDDDFDDDEDRDDEHDSLDDEIEEGLDELLSGEDVVPMSGLSADETSQKRKRAVADDSLDPPKDTAKR